MSCDVAFRFPVGADYGRPVFSLGLRLVLSGVEGQSVPATPQASLASSWVRQTTTRFTLRLCILWREMNVKELRWLFIAAVIALFIIGSVGEPTTLGISAGWTNNRYTFAGGTAPWALAFALVMIGLYLLLMYSSHDALGLPLPGIVRRFVAFWLDFIFAIMTVGPILGILPMLTEWRRTRVFQWSFERTTESPGDGIIATIGVLLIFIALVFYFALPLARRRPSPGACILGYQIVPDEGTTFKFRAALLRTLLGFIAACCWWLAPFLSRDRKKGKFWLDMVFETRAVRLG